MSTQSVSNALLDAMQIVVQSAISNLEYDTTIECKIVDHSKRAQHIYTVRAQEATFDVRNNNSEVTYYKGDIVYVTIPCGDMNSNEKFILGKKETSGSGGSFLFKSPFDDFIQFEELTFSGGAPQYAFVANNPAHQLSMFANTGVLSDPLENPGSQLGIQFDVETKLDSFKPIAGKYGLKIEVVGTVLDEDNKKQPHRMAFFFTTDHMYGNVYAFNSRFTQQRLFDISEFESITQVILSGYQDLKFKNIKGEMILYQDNSGNTLPNNIFFKNIQIFLGEHISILDQHPAYIHTKGLPRYGQNITSDVDQREQNKRSLSLSWVQRGGDNDDTADDVLVKDFDSFKKLWQNIYQEDDENTEEDESENLVEYGIYWYRYRAGTTYNITVDDDKTEEHDDGNDYNSDDKIIKDGWLYGGPGWEYLDPEFVNQEGSSVYQAFSLGTSDNANDCFKITVYPDIDQIREKYKVVVRYGISHDISNIIEFVNESKIIDPSTADGTNEQVVIQLLRKVTAADRSALTHLQQTIPTYPSIPLEEGSSDTACATKAIPYLIVDNTLQYRYVYDERNTALSDSTGTKYSSIPYYAIICQRDENGDYVPFLPDDADNMDVEWDFPTSNTMLKGKENITDATGDADLYEIRALISELHPAEVGEEDETRDEIIAYVEKYRKIIKRYYINSTFNETKRDNTIVATVNYNDKVYNPKKQIDFGQMGNSGSEYTLAISCRPIFESNVSTKGLPSGNYTCVEWGSYKSIGVEYTVYAMDNLGARVSLNGKTVEWKSLSIKNDGATSANTGTDPYSTPETSTLNNSGGIVARFMYTYSESEGRYPRAYIPVAVEVSVRGLESYPIVARKSFPLYRKADFVPLYNLLYPERIEFRSNGDAPLYYSGNLTAEKWIADETHENGGEWTSLETFKWVLYQSQSLKTRPEVRLKATGVNDTPPYKLEFNLGNNSAYPQWTDDFATKKHDQATVVYLRGQESGAADSEWVVRHAIVFDQNVYASSLLNKWNGSDLVLDEENGVVIANAIAAGVKNSLNNTFSGVIMGSWKEFGDSSIEATGLYGLQNGQQSFAINVDGSGFIGPSGGGRIYFDGRKALLRNAAKTSYINLNPDRTEDAFLFSQKDESNFVKINHNGTFVFSRYTPIPEGENESSFFNVTFKVNDADGFYIDSYREIDATQSTYNLKYASRLLLGKNNFHLLRNNLDSKEENLTQYWNTELVVDDADGFYIDSFVFEKGDSEKKAIKRFRVKEGSLIVLQDNHLVHDKWSSLFSINEKGDLRISTEKWQDLADNSPWKAIYDERQAAIDEEQKNVKEEDKIYIIKEYTDSNGETKTKVISDRLEIKDGELIVTKAISGVTSSKPWATSFSIDRVQGFYLNSLCYDNQKPVRQVKIEKGNFLIISKENGTITNSKDSWNSEFEVGGGKSLTLKSYFYPAGSSTPTKEFSVINGDLTIKQLNGNDSKGGWLVDFRINKDDGFYVDSYKFAEGKEKTDLFNSDGTLKNTASMNEDFDNYLCIKNGSILMKGTITATAGGSIGGFIINKDYLADSEGTIVLAPKNQSYSQAMTGPFIKVNNTYIKSDGEIEVGPKDLNLNTGTSTISPGNISITDGTSDPQDFITIDINKSVFNGKKTEYNGTTYFGSKSNSNSSQENSGYNSYNKDSDDTGNVYLGEGLKYDATDRCLIVNYTAADEADRIEIDAKNLSGETVSAIRIGSTLGLFANENPYVIFGPRGSSDDVPKQIRIQAYPNNTSGNVSYMRFGNTLKLSAGAEPSIIIGDPSTPSKLITIKSGDSPSIEIGDTIGLYTDYMYGDETVGQPTVKIGMKKSDNSGDYTGRLILGGLVMIGTTTKEYEYKEVKNFSLEETTEAGSITDDTNFTIKDGVVYVLDEEGKQIPKKDSSGNELKDENGNIIYETVDTISSTATVTFKPIAYHAVLNKKSGTLKDTTISAGTGYLSLGGSLILPKDAVVGCEGNGYLVGNWQIAAQNASISNTLYSKNGYIENLYVGKLSFGAGGMATEKWVADWIQSEWGLSQAGVNNQINDIVENIATLSSKINKTARIANNAASDAKAAVAKAVTGGAITVQGSELGTLSITLNRANGTLGNLSLTNSSAEFATQNHHHDPRLEVGQFGSITLKYNKGYSTGTPASAAAITGFAYNLRVDGDTLKWYDGSGTEKSFKKADAPTAAAASATYTYLVDRDGSSVGFDIRVGDANDKDLIIKEAGGLRVTTTNTNGVLKINVYDSTTKSNVASINVTTSIVVSQQVTTTSLGTKNVTATAVATIKAGGEQSSISKSVTESGL